MNEGCRDDDTSAKLLEKNKDHIELSRHVAVKNDGCKDACSICCVSIPYSVMPRGGGPSRLLRRLTQAARSEDGEKEANTETDFVVTGGGVAGSLALALAAGANAVPTRMGESDRWQ